MRLTLSPAQALIVFLLVALKEAKGMLLRGSRSWPLGRDNSGQIGRHFHWHVGCYAITGLNSIYFLEFYVEQQNALFYFPWILYYSAGEYSIFLEFYDTAKCIILFSMNSTWHSKMHYSIFLEFYVIQQHALFYFPWILYETAKCIYSIFLEFNTIQQNSFFYFPWIQYDTAKFIFLFSLNSIRYTKMCFFGNVRFQ
jgi:hypothetical protein